MTASLTKTLVLTAIAGVTAMTAAVVPAHAASYGTYTHITSPSGTKYFSFNADVGATNHFTVSGRASSDVTSVDLDCVFRSTSGVTSTTLASSVPVSGGAFSGIATMSNVTPQCHLIAVPSADDPTSTYLASFTGPLLYTEATGVQKVGSVVFDSVAVDEQGSGIAAVAEQAGCSGVALLATIMPPSMTVEGTGPQICLASLAPTNLAGTGSTTTVDGNNAYLPPDVHSYLIGSRSLTVTQSALTVSFHLAANHDLSLTESAPLMRCSGANTYPPTTTTCPSLVKTGVSLSRVVNLFRGAHQVQTSYRLTSTDGHAHSVRAEFISQTAPPAIGAIGYAFPGHGAAVKPVSKGEKVTGLGSAAGTVVVRSDVDASADDLTTQTFAITWSRAPSSVQFAAGSTNAFGMQYSLAVPAHGVAAMGFADTEETTTAPALSLAKVAVAGMVATPTVTKPGGTVHGKTTTVAGTVAAGINGLVRRVTVNGHKATLTAVGTTSDKFTVTFKEPLGTHKVTVVATDTAGNTSSTSVTVKNIH